MSAARSVPVAGSESSVERRRLLDPLQVAAALRGGAGARGIDENSPHDRRGDREKVGAVLPVHGAGVHQPHVRFVHERGRIRAGAGPFLPDVLPSEPAQVVVDERRQALERRLVAATPRFEQCRYV